MEEEEGEMGEKEDSTEEEEVETEEAEAGMEEAEAMEEEVGKDEIYSTTLMDLQTLEAQEEAVEPSMATFKGEEVGMVDSGEAQTVSEEVGVVLSTLEAAREVVLLISSGETTLIILTGGDMMGRVVETLAHHSMIDGDHGRKIDEAVHRDQGMKEMGHQDVVQMV